MQQLYKVIPALLVAVGLLLSGCQSPHSTAKVDADGFHPLFNGKNLDGWVNVNCAPETWSVTNGLIHCTGKPIGALRTVRQYENFILELDWRHLKPAGNAGVFVWASPISWPGVPFLRAVEVQVLDNAYGQTANYTTHGDVFPIHGSTMEPFGRHHGMRSFPSEERSHSSPEWNHYRVVATNGVIRLSVNGKEVSGGSHCNWRKGYLGLESEGSPVEFRNLRIKELPPSGAPAEETAPVETNWTALYNGVDLRGWKSDNLKSWQPNDWRLVLKPDGQSQAPLLSEKTFRDVEVIVDFKTPDKLSGNGSFGGLMLSGKPAVTFGGGDGVIVINPDKLKPKTWYRVRAQLADGKLTVYLRDDLIGSTLFAPAIETNWPVGLLNEGQMLEYANVYVRKLADPTPKSQSNIGSIKITLSPSSTDPLPDNLLVNLEVENTGTNNIVLDKDLAVGFSFSVWQDGTQEKITSVEVKKYRKPETDAVTKRFVTLKPGESIKRSINFSKPIHVVAEGHMTESKDGYRIHYGFHYDALNNYEITPRIKKLHIQASYFGTWPMAYSAFTAWHGISVKDLGLLQSQAHSNEIVLSRK